MTNERAKKIKEEIFTAKWTDLSRHYALGSVYLIQGDVDLVELSIGVADDDTALIKSLLDSAKMGQIPDSMATKFQEDNASFQCSIVQPFVFIQLLDEKKN